MAIQDKIQSILDEMPSGELPMPEVHPEDFPIPTFYRPPVSAFEADMDTNVVGAKTVAEIGAEAAIEDPYFIPDGKPLQVSAPITKPQIGFFENLWENFKDQSHIASVSNWASNRIENYSHLGDESSENWSVWNVENFANVDQKYYPYLSQSHGEKDMAQRREWAFERMEKEEYMQTGGWVSALLGGGLGATIGSPDMLFIPGMAAIRGAKYTESILKQTLRAVPEASVFNVAHNAILNVTDEAGTAEKFLTDVLRDEVFAIGLIAGGSGLSKAYSGSKIYNTKHIVDLQQAGIEVQQQMGVDGIERLIAKPKYAMNAARVEQAQAYLDSTMAKEGLFKSDLATKVFSKINPFVDYLNSPFVTVSEVANNFFTHTLRTKALADGQAANFSLQFEVDTQRNISRIINHQINGLFYASNGIEGGATMKNGLKMLTQRLGQGLPLSKREFSNRVRSAVVNETQDSSRYINDAAKILDDRVVGVYKDYLKAYNFDENILDPRTAKNYLMRVYDYNNLNMQPQVWQKVIAQELHEQDIRIEALLHPINSSLGRVNYLKGEVRKAKDEKLRNKLVDDLAVAESEHERTLDAHRAELDKPENAILLQDRNYIRNEDAKNMKAAFKPIEDINTKIDDIKFYIETSNEVIAKKNKQLEKTKISDKEAKATRSEIESLKKDVELQKNDLETLRNQKEDYHNQMLDKIVKGQVPVRWYKKDNKGAFIEWHDYKAAPKLRERYNSHDHRLEAANAYRDKILGNTPEQIAAHMLGSLFPAMHSNHLLDRSLMIPDSVLIDNNFLSPEIGQSLMSYTNMLAKKSVVKTRYQGFDDMDGVKVFAKTLKEEHDAKIAELDTLKPKMKQEDYDRASKKITKDFNKSKDDVGYMLETFFGVGNPKDPTKRLTQNLRNMAILTKLGNVPLAMLPELGAMIFKAGPMQFLMKGLVPLVQSVGHRMKIADGATREEMKQYAAHSLLSIEHMIEGVTNKMWNHDSGVELPANGRFSSALQSMTESSGNIFLTNQAQNILEGVQANIVQSKIMQHIYEYADGKLSQAGKDFLLTYGISPETWSKRFIDQYKKFGGKKGPMKTYSSKYYNWDDLEAQNLFSKSVRKAVQDSIIKRGPLDIPRWANNEIGKLVFLFHGYTFAAFTRFTAPLLQRPDANKIMGVLTSLMLGSLVDPLRKFMKGESFSYDDEDSIIRSAIDNSGVLGEPVQLVEMLDSLLAHNLLGQSTSDKKKNITLMGTLGGPAMGMLEDAAQVATMLVSGKFNQKNVKEGIGIIPYFNAFYLRALFNKLSKSLDLPETAGDAEPYSFRN